MKLGTDLTTLEASALKKFLDGVGEIRIDEEDFTAQTASEVEFFFYLVKLARRAWANHESGKTEADLSELMDELIGNMPGELSLNATDEDIRQKIFESDNEELKVLIRLQDMLLR